MPSTLVILGASARAAAFSARRAGLAPWTADLFADADLTALCPTRRVRDYPAELERAAREAPPGPWMYTGALENHPGLIDRIAAVRPLWGNGGETLRLVRDPWKVREALVARGIPCPALAEARHGLPPGEWLRKPRRSAGGAHIERLGSPVSPAAPRPDSRDPYYYQEWIAGSAVSGVYVAAAQRAQLLGVTQQWVGAPWTGARDFQYAGSLGPLTLTDEQRQAWRNIGDCLAERFALTGLFGVDAIETVAGVFPVEINPRYTASVEVLERGANLTAVTLHAEACREGRLPSAMPAARTRACGKAVLYARRTGPASEAFWRFLDDRRHGSDPAAWPCVADLPHVGEIFQAGRPVMTLLAEGDSEAAVLHALQAQAREVFARLESGDSLAGRFQAPFNGG